MSRADVYLAGIDPMMAGVDPWMGAGQLVAPRALAPAMQRLAAVSPAPAQLQAARPQDTRNLPSVPLPVDSGATLIAAGATVNINVIPVSDVRITDFTVQNSAAPNFIINGILFGRVSQFAGAGSVPAERYLANANRPPMEVTRVPAGTIIQVSVTNTSGADARFLGVFDCLDLTYIVGR